jgi:hypothetical protein
MQKETSMTIKSKIFEILIEFEVMERHCELGKKMLESELKEIQDLIDNNLEGADDNYAGAFLADINDEFIEVYEVLPRLQWYSQFLVAYSFFEKSLNDICKLLQTYFEYSLSINDLSGQGITRAKNYLSKVAGVTKPFKMSEWQSAKLFADIRNAIAHKNGFVDILPNDSGSLFARLSNRNDLELKQELADQTDAQIQFGMDFVSSSINAYKVIIFAIGETVSLQKDGG